MYSSLIEKINSNSQLWENVFQTVNNSDFIGKISMSEKEKVFFNRIEKIIRLLEYNNILIKKVF